MRAPSRNSASRRGYTACTPRHLSASPRARARFRDAAAPASLVSPSTAAASRPRRSRTTTIRRSRSIPPWSARGRRYARPPTRRPPYRSSTACAAWMRTRSTTSPMARLHSGCSARMRSARCAARAPAPGCWTATRPPEIGCESIVSTCRAAGSRAITRSRWAPRGCAFAHGSRRPPAHRATSSTHSRTRCSRRKRGSPKRSPRTRARSRSWTARCGCAPSASAWRATSSASSTGTSMRVNSRSCPISPWASARHCSASPAGARPAAADAPIATPGTCASPTSDRTSTRSRASCASRRRWRCRSARRRGSPTSARWRCRGSPPRRCATRARRRT